MFFHKAFLFIWMIDLVVFPVLALLDLGFSFGIKSSFYPRFGYVVVFGLVLGYVLIVKRKIVFHPLILVFLIVLGIGLLKGGFEGTLTNMGQSGSPVVFSHIFYVVMPIVMLCYGWYFFEAYKHSDVLKRRLSRVMYLAFFVGLGVVVLFQLAYQAVLSSYNAIGIWNFVYAAPYLLYQPHGSVYFYVSALATLFAGKRGILIVFIVFLVLSFFLARGSGRLKALVIIPVMVAAGWFLFADFLTSGVGRIELTVLALQDEDLALATAGRFTEAMAAIGYLNSRIDHWILGAGFGAQFIPWPDNPGYADYFSHYSHFSPVSYAWIGGLWFTVAVYAVLIGTAISLVSKIKRGRIERSNYYFVYWLWGIIAISPFGGVLMNNSFIWFIIGCCLNLNRRSAGYNR